jgi:hypothetical protein
MEVVIRTEVAPLIYYSALKECCGTGYLKNFCKGFSKKEIIKSLISIKNNNSHKIYNTVEGDIGAHPRNNFKYEGGFRGAIVLAQLTEHQQDHIDALLSLGFRIVDSSMNHNSGNILNTLAIHPSDLNKALEEYE